MAYLLCAVLFAFLVIHSQHATAMTPYHLVPFSKVLNNYPTQTQDSDFLNVAGLSSRITGATDALRVSHALFLSGYAIRIGDNQYGWSKTVTMDCARYIATADTMTQFLTAKIGVPIVGSTQQQFVGKQGIAIFTGCGANQADYVDLLYDNDGTPQCKKQACAFSCSSINLFEVV